MDRALLLVHAVLGCALVGALTHNFLWSLPYLRGRHGRAKAERRFLRWGARLFAGTFVAGLILYPAYKLQVRVGWLDIHRPWVGRLFDIKEHLASLAMAALVAQTWLARRCHPSTLNDRLNHVVYVSLSGLGAGLAWIVALIGLYTTTHRSFGAGG